MNRFLTVSALCAAAIGALPAASEAAPAPDPSALVATAQSTPLHVDGGSLVGQAAVTRGGTLVVRLAGPNPAGVDGERVLAQTSRTIDDEFAGDPGKARVSISLDADGTGTTTLDGDGASASYDLAWNAKTPSIRIVSAQAGLGGVCGAGRSARELVTHDGSSCRSALTLMRGWRNSGNPSRYHGYRCGDVPGAHVGFARDQRWFATWQCRRDTVSYRIWTRY